MNKADLVTACTIAVGVVAISFGYTLASAWDPTSFIGLCAALLYFTMVGKLRVYAKAPETYVAMAENTQ